jgi:hypothetical protein
MDYNPLAEQASKNTTRFQIATAIVLPRLIIWVPFHLWRLRRERRLG